MDLLWLRVAIALLAIVMTWRSMDDHGLTQTSFHWWIGGVSAMQLTHLAEALLGRWQLRREIRAYLRLDPYLRARLVDRVWLSVMRNYLREQLDRESHVDILGGAERYPFPVMDSRLVTRLYWALAAVAAVLLASTLDFVALVGGMRVAFLLLGGAFLVALAYLHRRARYLATMLEVTPFTLVEIHPDGSRRVIAFNQPLQLRNRPRLGRLELRAVGDATYIRIDYDRVGFQRLLDKVLTYGGFREPAA